MLVLGDQQAVLDAFYFKFDLSLPVVARIARLNHQPIELFKELRKFHHLRDQRRGQSA